MSFKFLPAQFFLAESTANYNILAIKLKMLANLFLSKTLLGTTETFEFLTWAVV
jgi:hypothetical protein